MRLLRLVVATTLMLAFLSLSDIVPAQVPVEQLAKPPEGARQFTILSTSGVNGHSYMWTTADGTRMSRESILLRGQKWEVDQEVKLGPDRMPTLWVVRGSTPNGDAGETFRIEGHHASWKSPVDKGEADYTSPAFYSSFGGTTADGSTPRESPYRA